MYQIDTVCQVEKNVTQFNANDAEQQLKHVNRIQRYLAYVAFVRLRRHPHSQPHPYPPTP